MALMQDRVTVNEKIDIDLQKKYEITLEKHLEILGQEFKAYEELYSSWITAKRLLTKLLSSISMVFPHYSMHDDSHSKTIIQNIERVLGVERIKKLEPTETWLLLMCAYSHDIGMLVKHEDLQEAWKCKDFKNFIDNSCINEEDKVLQKYAVYIKSINDKELFEAWPIEIKWGVVILSAEYFRSKHAENSKKYIIDMNRYGKDFKIDFSFNGLIPIRIIKLLGEIVALHVKQFKDIFDLPYQANGIAGDSIYPRGVAELLRLGDLLDLDNGRFNENMNCLYGEFPEQSELHKKKHEAITHILVLENYIEVTADCPDEGTYQIVDSWFKWLNQEVTSLSLHWNKIMTCDFGSAISLPNVNILLNGEKLQNDVLLRFDFKTEDVFELLEGANIYESKYTFFRELIQNAMDATKLRLWELVKDGVYEIKQTLPEKYFPTDLDDEIYNGLKIRVNILYRQDENQYDIEITDKGIGLNEKSLDNMSHVAKSWGERIEWKRFIESMPNWLRPTGGFGLGLQSVFKMTDCMECITKPSDEYAKKVTFRSRKKGGSITYQRYKEFCDIKVGTTFKFTIPGKKCEVQSFSLGGFYYQVLENYDPFSADGTLDIYQMLERIFHEVGHGLFPVEITASVNTPENIIFHDTIAKIKMGPMTIADGLKEKNSWYYHIAYEKPSIDVYDIEKSIRIEILIRDSQQLTNICFFKGMPLKSDNLSCFGDMNYYVGLTIYLDGLETKEYLTINREKIKSEKEHEIRKMIQASSKMGLEIFFTGLLEQDNLEKIPVGKAWLSIAFLYEIWGQKNTRIEEIILEHMQGKFEVLKKTEGNFHLQDKDIKDILKDIWSKKDCCFFNSSIYHKYPKPKQEDMEDLLNKNLANLIGIDEVVLYERYGDFLNARNISGIYGVENDIFILNIGSETEIPHINTVAEIYFLKDLLRKPRAVILGMEKYRNLIVKEVPPELTMSMNLHGIRQFYYGKYIISPFNEKDIAIVKNSNPQTIWNEISGREDFKNLLRWIKKNSFVKDISEEALKTDYERLIKDVVSIEVV
jgi:hypothetical protein